MILTSPTSPDEYIGALSGWQFSHATALRHAVLDAAPGTEEQPKWGHLVYVTNGPVLLIRAEPQRVLFGFWRGRRLRHIEPRLRPGGKYGMATLELKPDTPLARETVTALVVEAIALNRSVGDPTAPVRTAR